MKLMDGATELDEDTGEHAIRLINRDEFIHSEDGIYELTTITIYPDDPDDAIAQRHPHLITGFF